MQKTITITAPTFAEAATQIMTQTTDAQFAQAGVWRLAFIDIVIPPNLIDAPAVAALYGKLHTPDVRVQIGYKPSQAANEALLHLHFVRPK